MITMSFVPAELEAPYLSDRESRLQATGSDTFFDIDPGDVRRIKDAGYQRIGVGVAILNQNGEILISLLKDNYKTPGDLFGITSETVQGTLLPEGVQLEPTQRTIARCLEEELSDIDLNQTDLTTRLVKAYSLSEWPIGVDPSLGKLFGINVALLAGHSTNKFIGIHDTAEVYESHFMTLDQIYRLGNDNLLRPGTMGCLESLGQAGLLEVDNLRDAYLDFSMPSMEIPARSGNVYTGTFDIDLSIL